MHQKELLLEGFSMILTQKFFTWILCVKITWQMFSAYKKSATALLVETCDQIPHVQ